MVGREAASTIASASFDGLTRPHLRPRSRLTIVLLALDERLHVDRREQADFMSQLLKLAAPPVRRRAGFHSDHTPWMLRHKSHELSARKLLAKDDRPVVTSSMQLEDPLCQVDADDSSFGHGCSLLL
jgi:hypothetical protein